MARPNLTLIAALLLAAGMLGFFFGLWLPASRRVMVREGLAGGFGFGNDFYQIWITSHELLARRADAYSAEMQRQIEVGLYGRPLDRSLPGDATTPFRGDCYPLHASVLAIPLAPLPFRGVQIVLSVLLPLAVIACVLLWCDVLRLRVSGIERVAIVLLALSTIPVLEGIYALQTSLLVALLIPAAIFLIQRGQLFFAGVLLAVATVKPQLILLLMVWLAVWSFSSWKERKPLLTGFVVTSSVLLGITTWVSPGWFAGWMHSVHEYRKICPPPLAEFVLGRTGGVAVSVLLVAGAALVGWRERRETADSDGFVLATVLVIAVTVPVLPSTVAVYDQFLLFPAVMWLGIRRKDFWSRTPLRWLAGIIAAALGWQWLAASLIVILSLVVPEIVHRPGALLIPLGTAASVPFGVAGLMSFVALTRGAWSYELRATKQDP